MGEAHSGGYVRGRVSVVTPVYNGEGHLHRLFDSVLAQSWNEVEMIVVDDGSQDETLRVAGRYREKFRARGYSYTILHQEHRNASAALNRGLPRVTGEFLIWPDSDDALAPDSVERRVRFLRENPQYQCVRSTSRYMNERGEPVPAREQRGDLEDQRLFFPILEGRTYVCCGCYMLRTEAFFSIYPRRRIPEYEVGQNFQMLLPFLYLHRCPTIPEELYDVYVRPSSHSSRVLTQEQEAKRLAGFEALVGELAELCGIDSRAERKRLRLWKWRNRWRLYRRHRQWGKMLFAGLWTLWNSDLRRLMPAKGQGGSRWPGR